MTDKNPFEDYYDDITGFDEPIANGTYCFRIDDVRKFKRDKHNTLRAEFELSIIAELIDGELVQSIFDNRKIWENTAVEGEQIVYFTSKLLRALRLRNPGKASVIDNIPFLPDSGKVTDIVVPDGQETEVENYHKQFLGLDVIIKLSLNKKETDKGFGFKYYLNFPKDQSAGLEEIKDDDPPF